MPRRNLVVGTVVHAPEKALVAGEPLLPAHAVEQRREEKAVPVGIERNGIDVTRLGIADNLPIARIVDRAAATVDGVVTVQILEAHVTRIGDVLLGGLHDVVLVALAPERRVDLGLVLKQPVADETPDLAQALPLVVIGKFARGVVIAVDHGIIVGQRRLDPEIERFARQPERVVVAQRDLIAVGAHIGVVALGSRCSEGIGKRRPDGVHVDRFADVVVGREVQPAVQETGVQSYVEGFGGFPADVVGNLPREARVAQLGLPEEVAGRIARTGTEGRQTERFEIGVGIDVAVAQRTVRSAHFEVRNSHRADIPKLLLRNAPGGRSRREETPLRVIGEFRGTVVAAVDFEQIAVVVGVVETEEGSHITPAATAAGDRHDVAQREVDVAGVGHQQTVALRVGRLVVLLLVVVTGQRLEIVLLGEGVLEFGVGVGGHIGRQLQRLLHHVVGLGRAEIDSFALVGTVRNGSGLLGFGVVLGAEREVARQVQAVFQHRDVECGGVFERLGRTVEPIVARHQSADGIGARLGQRTVGIEDRRRGMPLIVDRTPQHAATLLRIAHRLTIAVVRIVEVIAYFQPFEHL